MRKLILGLFTLASLYLPFSGPVEAQTAGQASVVGTCGTASYPTGTVRPVTQDTTGTQCASGGGGGGGSNAAAGPTGSAVPADGSYNALNVGGTLRGQTGANPSGTVYSAQTDLTSVNGVTTLTGAGATGTGSQRNTVAQDITTVAGAAPATTGIYVTGPSAAALATAAAQATEIASLATIATNSGSPIPAGTALIGKVGIDQTTPGTTNAVQEIGGTTGGLTVSTFEPAASDNHTNLKNGAGQVYWVTAFNNSATINYLRLYNAATGFNGCGSATNLVAVLHIPANTSDAGFVLNVPTGMPFSTGISYCVVSAYGQTTTTSATASAMDINIGYK